MNWTDAIGIAWFLAIGGLMGGAQISVQQARYYDGDSDAHWYATGKGFDLLRSAKHPQAVRALRRGRILLGLGVATMLAGAVARSLL